MLTLLRRWHCSCRHASPAAQHPILGAPSSGTGYIDPPGVTAQSVFSYDLATGITLYEKNPDERMQIGSTVKVATALVVMKHGKPKMRS